MTQRASLIAAMLAAFAATILLTAGQAAAQQSGERSELQYQPSTNAGSVFAQVVSVDYQRGVLTLDAKSRGRIDVQVLPSTNIVDKKTSGYLTIADLKKGSRVKVFLSKHADTLNAQIIEVE